VARSILLGGLGGGVSQHGVGSCMVGEAMIDPVVTKAFSEILTVLRPLTLKQRRDVLQSLAFVFDDTASGLPSVDDLVRSVLLEDDDE